MYTLLHAFVRDRNLRRRFATANTNIFWNEIEWKFKTVFKYLWSRLDRPWAPRTADSLRCGTCTSNSVRGRKSRWVFSFCPCRKACRSWGTSRRHRRLPPAVSVWRPNLRKNRTSPEWETWPILIDTLSMSSKIQHFDNYRQ